MRTIYIEKLRKLLISEVVKDSNYQRLREKVKEDYISLVQSALEEKLSEREREFLKNFPELIYSCNNILPYSKDRYLKGSTFYNNYYHLLRIELGGVSNPGVISDKSVLIDLWKDLVDLVWGYYERHVRILTLLEGMTMTDLKKFSPKIYKYLVEDEKN